MRRFRVCERTVLQKDVLEIDSRCIDDVDELLSI